jgi:RNA polymerase sigma-70 factor (ECF subfamily)
MGVQNQSQTKKWNGGKLLTSQLIHAEIKKLPNGCSQVFTLFVLEDYSHK